MPKFSVKYPKVSHVGHRVSHAKNRSKYAFKRNLHTVTVISEGKKIKMKVPTKVLKQLKKAGVTTHYKKAE